MSKLPLPCGILSQDLSNKNDLRIKLIKLVEHQILAMHPQRGCNFLKGRETTTLSFDMIYVLAILIPEILKCHRCMLPWILISLGGPVAVYTDFSRTRGTKKVPTSPLCSLLYSLRFPTLFTSLLSSLPHSLDVMMWRCREVVMCCSGVVLWWCGDVVVW